ncbi:MAG: ATP-binding protein [Thermodesulfobacteriota bacterium]
MSSKKITFKLENKLSELKRLHQQLEAFAKEHQLPLKDIFEINLCLEEHFTNILSHGYADRETHWIDITLSVEQEKFIACIEDDGIPFNPTAVPAPDFKCPLEERKVGGLGVHLTRHYLDSMAYQRRGGINILMMTKKIDSQAEGV